MSVPAEETGGLRAIRTQEGAHLWPRGHGRANGSAGSRTTEAQTRTQGKPRVQTRQRSTRAACFQAPQTKTCNFHRTRGPQCRPPAQLTGRCTARAGSAVGRGDAVRIKSAPAARRSAGRAARKFAGSETTRADNSPPHLPETRFQRYRPAARLRRQNRGSR